MTVPSKFYADVDELAQWAKRLMDSRDPDFIIGDNYLRRWWVVPRNHFQNVYLHEINISDDARALHDHPWDNISFILDGIYTEVTAEGEFIRRAGDVVSRKATDAHRLVVEEGARVISLFLTGPIIRQWGFHCPQGWRPWQDFVEVTANSSVIGRGCGE